MNVHLLCSWFIKNVYKLRFRKTIHMFRKLSILTIFSGILLPVFSQTVLTVEEAVEKAISTNRNVAAASHTITQQKQLVKSAINLPNPEFFWESPTGSFYTGSITQSFEFPTVYGKQVQLQKQQVVIAEKDKLRTEKEVAYRIHLLYLAIQYTDALQKELKIQDSVFNQLQIAAQRQFDAGQIDYLQKTFTENEYGDLHNQFLQTSNTLTSLAEQLQFLTDTKEAIAVTSLQLFSIPEGLLTKADTFLVNDNPAISMLKQEIEVNRKNLELQKNKALPGLAFGYFNQGERNTPTSLRFRFGITVPLWFWQYKSNIQAAKTGISIAEEKTRGFKQQLNYELMQVKNEMKVNYQSFNYYLNIGLPKAEEIINTSKRFFESGETDYINYLRNINTAYQSRLKYIETINNLNHSIITINFLTGKL